MFDVAVILKLIGAAAGMYVTGFAAGKAAAWVRAIGNVL